MLTKYRCCQIAAFVFLGLSVMGCRAKEPAQMLSVRNLAEARFATPPALGTITVRAMVSTKNIEGMILRDIGCLDFCESVLGLDFPDANGHAKAHASSENELVLDRALAAALEKNGADFACMVLKVKPRIYRSTNPNILGDRYRIGRLDFVEVVDANSCPRSREDRPLRFDQQPQFSYSETPHRQWRN
jgi:hypothetical protein